MPGSTWKEFTMKEILKLPIHCLQGDSFVLWRLFVIQGLEIKSSDFRVLSEGNLGRPLTEDKFDMIDNFINAPKVLYY